ncbi:MAG: dihydroorotase [Paludibacteraceae bacterium]|nr:dihydroorotase [Paludibacteraceae bacterium]
MEMIEIPAMVDLHVHFREPGFEYKETIETGMRAAKTAGYSDVFTMPNLRPAQDTVEHLMVQLEAIEKASEKTKGVTIHPYGCITMGQKGDQLTDFEALAPYVAGFSDDGHGVQRTEIMLEAMKICRKLGKPIVAHCEVNDLLRGGYIHDGDYAKMFGHKGICSESEWRMIERDLNLVKLTGCQYHVCHISTKESVNLIREAKKSGLPVTCETAPHYLLLTDMDLREEGRFKMNPPLRTDEDRMALVEGIVDGTIDCIATDHAPHSAEEKAKGLSGSSFGIVGLETAFPLMYTYFVNKGIITLEKLVELMSYNARKIMHLGKGRMIKFDVEKEFVIDPGKFESKGKATPFTGWKVVGRLVE